MKFLPPDKHFWDWFRNHVDEYENMEVVSEAEYDYWMNELQIHLRVYCRYLDGNIINCEVPFLNVLIISAGLRRKFFKKADKLVAKAPAIEGWMIISLIPQRPVDYLIEMGFSHTGVDPKRMWFFPHGPGKDGRVSFIVVVESPLDSEDDELGMAVQTVLLNLLGERSFCSDIEHWAILSTTPARPVTKAALPIEELPDYIANIRSDFVVGANGEIKKIEYEQ